MNQDEYKDFVAQANSGALLIGIDRAFARKFYTQVSLSKIEQETGEAPHFERTVVWFAAITAQIAFLASVILSILAFRWWAPLVIAISFAVSFVFTAWSSMPGRGMLRISIWLALTVGNLFIGGFTSQFVAWYFVAVVFALWASRFVYCAATTFLRAFVLRNQRTLAFMRGYIRVRAAGDCSANNPVEGIRASLPGQATSAENTTVNWPELESSGGKKRDA